jgi:hypothetical protein
MMTPDTISPCESAIFIVKSALMSTQSIMFNVPNPKLFLAAIDA